MFDLGSIFKKFGAKGQKCVAAGSKPTLHISVVSNSLNKARKHGVEAEVVLSAMAYMDLDRGIDIEQAFDKALTDWNVA